MIKKGYIAKTLAEAQQIHDMLKKEAKLVDKVDGKIKK